MKHSANRLGLKAVLLVSLYAGGFIASVNASMPVGVVDLVGDVRPYVKMLWPQGWAFFTKNAKSPAMTVYRYSDEHGWMLDGVGRNAEARHLFGWIRRPRATLIEAGFLMAFARSGVTECMEQPEFCLSRAQESAIPLINPTPEPFLCGRVGFVSQEPLPWVWRNARDETVMPSKIVVIDAECNETP